MPQMTPAQARLIDPVLTEVARGFRSLNAPVANLLFPRVTVFQRGGRIVAFGPDDYKLAITVRAPGANTKRVQFGYSSDPFALVDYSLEGLVPIELQQEGEATAPGLDQAEIAIRRVQNTMDLERENDAAKLALDPAKYAASNKATLTSTDLWDDPASDPFTDIADAREAVRQQIGSRPNLLVLSPKARTALSKHPKVLDKIAITTDRTPATLAQLARQFELEQVVEGATVFHNGVSFVDLWGKSALLAYTPPASLAEMGSPNFGYTYQLAGYPLVEEPYYDRNPKSWLYPTTDARQAVLVGPSAGFLFTQVVS